MSLKTLFFIGTALTIGCSGDDAKTEGGEAGKAADTPAKKAEREAEKKKKKEEARAKGLAKVANYYGDYYSDDRTNPDNVDAKDAKKNKKIYWFKLLPDGKFECNGSNYKKETRRGNYYVSDASASSFTINFKDMSTARNLEFSFGSEGENASLSVSGTAPFDCGWSLSGGDWNRGKVVTGDAPEYEAAPKLVTKKGEKKSASKGDWVDGPDGKLKVKSFKFMRKIGFSKADDDEQFAQIGVEIQNADQSVMDLEARYEEGCDSFFTGWDCSEGGHDGNVFSCSRPHWGDKFEKGILKESKKATFNCCYKFEKPSSDCKATVDGSAIGLGEIKVSL